MGNPLDKHAAGPCKTCNANGGLWHGEQQTVRCLRPLQAGKHVLRGVEATRWNHVCWQPVDEPLPLDSVVDLIDLIKVKSKRER